MAQDAGAAVAKHSTKTFCKVAMLVARAMKAVETNVKKLEQVVGVEAPVVQQKIQEHQNIVYLCLGIVLNFHGSHFSKFIIAVETVKHLKTEKVTSGFTELMDDLKAAKVAMKKAEEDIKGSKKTGAEQELMSVNIALKSIDPGKVTHSGLLLWGGAMACIATLNHSIAQAFSISKTLTKLLMGMANGYIKDHDVYDGLEDWVKLGLSSIVQLALLTFTFLEASFMLSVHHSMLGTTMLLDGGFQLAAKFGKIKEDNREALRNSPSTHAVQIVLFIIGVYWQLTSKGLGLLYIPYLPLTVAEYLTGLLKHFDDKKGKKK